MLGSDWPRCLLAGSYGDAIDTVRYLVAELSAHEQAEIDGLTAMRVYRLALGPSVSSVSGADHRGPFILAHDLGTSGDKASLHAADGRLLAAHSVPYATDFGPGGKAEQDPADWWAAFCAATRTLLEETGTRPADIACVAMSGQMMGVVLVDAHDETLRPGHHLGGHPRPAGSRPARGTGRLRACLRAAGASPRPVLLPAQVDVAA